MVALGSLLVSACAGSTSSVRSDRDAADTVGAQYEGDGVQCGALVCSSTQQCCLVIIEADASKSNPTHACDQNCESVCADTCPDAGGRTSMVAPMGGMPMGGMPMGGMPMGGTGGPPDAMASPMGAGPAGHGGPAAGPQNDAGGK